MQCHTASLKLSLDSVTKLVVHVHAANGLRAADLQNSSDPYVRVEWHTAGKKSSGKENVVGETTVIDNTLDAKWADESFELCEIDHTWFAAHRVPQVIAVGTRFCKKFEGHGEFEGVVTAIRKGTAASAVHSPTKSPSKLPTVSPTKSPSKMPTKFRRL